MVKILPNNRVVKKVGIASILGMILGAISFVIGSVMIVASIFEMNKTKGDVGIALYILGIALLIIGIALGILWLISKVKK